jgi:hypothetical protein
MPFLLLEPFPERNLPLLSRLFERVVREVELRPRPLLLLEAFRMAML